MRCVACRLLLCAVCLIVVVLWKEAHGLVPRMLLWDSAALLLDPLRSGALYGLYPARLAALQCAPRFGVSPGVVGCVSSHAWWVALRGWALRRALVTVA